MTDFLLLAFIFLTASVVAVPIASRLGLGSVLGYLIAGIAISPILTQLHVDVVSIQHFAEFGVVMMLFLVGLELEPRRLWQMRHRLVGLGGGQVALSTLAIGGVAMAFGQNWNYALAIGLIFALSSTAIVLQTLNEKGLMRSDGGRAGFSVLLTQDIAVIPMLALIPLLAVPELTELAHHGAQSDDHGSFNLVEGMSGWLAALVTLGAIALVVLAGSTLVSPLFRFIAAAGLRELFVAAALMLVVGIALLMSLVGLSAALGTFIAGVVLANSEYRHELESDIDPFRGLLLGLFFMSVGAGINFALLYEKFFMIAALTLGLITIKMLILLLLGHFFKLRGADRFLFGLGLAQAGEFGFVLLEFCVSNGVLPKALSEQLLLIVALSMLLTPLLFIVYDRLIAPHFSVREERQADEIDEKGNVIIAGVGRFGGVINRILTGAGYNTTVIDFNSSFLDVLKAFDVRAYYGDATRPDLLEAAGISEAKMMVIAINDKEQITSLVKYVRQHYPHVHVIARAVTRHHVYELYAAGCRDIIRDTFDSAVRGGRSALEALGIDRKKAQKMIDGFVQDDQAMMIVMAELYDPDIPVHENAAYVAKSKQLRDLMNFGPGKRSAEFGTLKKRLAEIGEDTEEIIRRYNEADQNR